MFRPYINQIRIQLDKLNPDQKLKMRLTGSEEPDKGAMFSHIPPDERSSSMKLLEGVIWYLYKGDLETVSAISTRQDISGIERAELAIIAFDLAVEFDNVEVQYILASNFFFDEIRISTGILNYAEQCVNQNNLAETAAVIKKFRSKLVPEQRQQVGKRLFQSALAYPQKSDKVDYILAHDIYKIFEIDNYFIDPIIQQHYEYEMTNRNFRTAAELARSFDLDSHRLKEAAYRALEEMFDKFREKYHLGLYPYNSKLAPGDPFNGIGTILKTYGLLDEFHLLDPSGKNYYQKSQELGFFFLKKISQELSKEPEELWVSIFFSAHLISRFRLDSISNIKIAKEIDDIIGKIAYCLDEVLQDAKLAPSYYHSLISYFNFLSSHKQIIRRLGDRLFNYLISEDRIKDAYEMYTAFQFQDNEVRDVLVNRVLLLLKMNKMEVFREYLDTFKLVPLIKNSEILLNRIYAQVEENIRHNNFKSAKSLADTFNLSSKQIFQPLRSTLSTLIAAGRDDDALKLMDIFDITISRITPILNEVYHARAAQDWQQGKKFRAIYRLNAFDVGIINWLMLEFFRIERLRTWYMGKEISPTKPPADSE